MALSATPAPRIRARAPHSMFSDRLTVKKLVTVFVLARVALLVLSGRVSANVVDDRRAVGRRVDVVLAGSDEDNTDTDDLHRAPGLQGPPTVQPQKESRAVRETVSSTLVVAGWIGLLGVAGAAALVVDSIAAPVRRVVRVLQAPAEGRPVQLITRAEESPTSAGVLPPGVEPVANIQVVIVPDVAEPRSVVPEIAQVVQQAAEAAAKAAKAAEARAAASAPAAPSVRTTRYAAARSRALGPTTALWHAVEFDRLAGAIGGACETTVCGSLVRVSAEQSWPVPARDVCPACATVAH